MKTPYVVIAQTIGPFFGFWAWPCRLLTGFVLNHAAHVTVRDDNSLETIAECHFRPALLKRLNEIVFLYPEKDSVQVEKLQPILRSCVGITFHHIYYRRWMTEEDYMARMVKFINLIIRHYGVLVKFISMEDSSSGRGDLPLLREIRSRLDTPEDVEIVDLPMDPRELLRFFGQMDFVVATKTHSVVYGLRQCIPTLAIAYDRKTEDFMHDFNQSDFSVNLSTFDPDDAFTRFGRLVENTQSIREELIDRLSEIQRQSLENINIIKNILNSSVGL